MAFDRTIEVKKTTIGYDCRPCLDDYQWARSTANLVYQHSRWLISIMCSLITLAKFFTGLNLIVE